MPYPLRRPGWQRLWLSLEPDRRKQIKSWCYSLSINASVLLVLALYTIRIPGGETIALLVTMGFADDAGEDVVTITPEPEEEPEDEEPEESDPEPAEEPVETEETPEPVEEGSTESLSEPNPADASDRLDGDASEAERMEETLRRVAAAGGNTDAPVHCSLAFSGDDDIDLHVMFRGKHRQREYSGRADGYIWYRNTSCFWGNLDVDANRRGGPVARYPCENIAFPYPPHQATYEVAIHHFHTRGRPEPTPYVVVVKYGSKSEVYSGNIMPGQHRTICRFSYRHRKKLRPPNGNFNAPTIWF